MGEKPNGTKQPNTNVPIKQRPPPKPGTTGPKK